MDEQGRKEEARGRKLNCPLNFPTYLLDQLGFCEYM